MKKVREIRASYNDNMIVVYQAFNKVLATDVVESQSFNTPLFKQNRMTWIKPSFLWMMYRSGWATKINQECVLQIQISRIGFEWALENSCLSHFDKRIYKNKNEWKGALANSFIRIQWDPERDIYFKPLPNRAIQIGLSGEAVRKYINEWIISVHDITDDCMVLHDLVKANYSTKVADMLPKETEYPLNQILTKAIGIV